MAILRINGLSKSFGIKTVFENVSFDIRSGERIGLVGANGAGKTTLLKCIRGDEEYDKGSVKASDGAIIGYLRQDFNYTSHTIREEMEEAWRDVLFYKDRIEALTKELEQHKDDEKLIEQYGKAEERFEFLGGYDYESMTKKILTGLGVDRPLAEHAQKLMDKGGRLGWCGRPPEADNVEFCRVHRHLPPRQRHERHGHGHHPVHVARLHGRCGGGSHNIKRLARRSGVRLHVLRDVFNPLQPLVSWGVDKDGHPVS